MSSGRHKELVERAGMYLVKNFNCNPVFLEKGSSRVLEYPDVIGWVSTGLSYLVEVKVTTLDAKADLSKPHRICPSMGMGNLRWLLIPEPLKESVPPPEGWGRLIYYEKTGVIRKDQEAKHMDKNTYAEIAFFVSRIKEVQRFGRLGVVKACSG